MKKSIELLENAYNLAKKILTENKPKLIELAQKLLVDETWKVKNWTQFSASIKSRASDSNSYPDTG